MKKEQYKYLLLWTPKWLERVYLKEGLSTYQIADVVGCNQSTVWGALKKLGLKRRKYTMSKMARLARQKGGIARQYKKKKDNAD
jgi:hypothetical protein